MRRRSRLREERRSASDNIYPPPETLPAWSDLSEEERTALKRLNRGRYPELADATGLRLIDLGLAVSRPDGIGISRLGRELVIDTLLASRQKDTD